jgi:hypothetical protein
MSPSATETQSTMVQPSKANIGVYTNPEHHLWVAEAEPSLESVQKGADLKIGEVTVGIKSTGICGYVLPSLKLEATGMHMAQLANSLPASQIRCSLLARGLHRPYDRGRHTHPRARIRRRDISSTPVRNDSQGRRPRGRRAQRYLQRMRAMPNWPL